MTRNEAIISIKPTYAEAILNGTKTVELRRRIPATQIGTRLWIYATRPTAAVIGSATVAGIIRGIPDQIWKETSSSAGISREKFDAYFDGSDEAIGLILTNITRSNPVNISQLRLVRVGFHPPQVIARLSNIEAQHLNKLARTINFPNYQPIEKSIYAPYVAAL